MTLVAHSRVELRAALDTAQGRRAVVMTMGALHEGHVQLMREARQLVGSDGVVVVTIFVNPTQFGVGEDFEKYPRTLAADVAACDAVGVDVVFAPDVEAVYGPDAQPQITVDPGPVAEILEGASRPGHFRGVLTVVLKLMNLVGPDFALFGEKDYQQLTLIRAMVADLNVPVEVVGVATVREPDGLAMSSRNRYLSDDERRAALAISAGLRAGVAAAQTGANAEGVRTACVDVLEAEPVLDVDYVSVLSADLSPTTDEGVARILVASRCGTTRLIDNCAVVIGEGAA